MDEITQLLEKRRAGDSAAEAKLVELVYPRLRRLAASFIRRERPGHTLQATALVHEAYLRILPENDRTLVNRSHFFALGAHHASSAGGSRAWQASEEAKLRIANGHTRRRACDRAGATRRSDRS